MSDGAGICWEGLHDWQLDPERRGEGLICVKCHLTEAELDGDNDE